jgi:FMN reductase
VTAQTVGSGERRTDPGSNGCAKRPLILGIGGTLRERSSSERVLRRVVGRAEDLGVDTEVLGAAELDFPLYRPDAPRRTPDVERFLSAVARADALVVATPGYHGGISGLVKNALDYIEELRRDRRPYLDGRVVGCIVCADGWQATVTTLSALRSVVHALRGWPTPLGVALNSADPLFSADGGMANPAVAAQLDLLAQQVVDFAARTQRGTAPS